MRNHAIVGTLSNGYTKSGPLPKVAPFRAPIAKLTRSLAAHHLSTTTWCLASTSHRNTVQNTVNELAKS